MRVFRTRRGTSAIGNTLATGLRKDTPVPLEAATKLVNADLLGSVRIQDLPFNDRDGMPLKVAADFFGNPRDSSPTPRPFENIGSEKIQLTEPSGLLVTTQAPRHRPTTRHWNQPEIPADWSP